MSHTTGNGLTTDLETIQGDGPTDETATESCKRFNESLETLRERRAANGGRKWNGKVSKDD